MTRNDTIRMALEAGIPAAKYPSLVSNSDWEALERFFHAAYAAGAAAEREACARVADDHERQRCEAWGKVLAIGGEVPSASLSAVAAAIRARGQA